MGMTPSGFLLVRSAVESICRCTNDHLTRYPVEKRIARLMFVLGIYQSYDKAIEIETKYQKTRNLVTHSSRIYVNEDAFKDCYENATKLIERIFGLLYHGMILEGVKIDDYIADINDRFNKMYPEKQK